MLTTQQAAMLGRLKSAPQTASEIAARFDETYDSVHACLRRLEDREFVRRIGSNPSRWELTAAGRAQAI